jgi:hypothetical protein
VVENAIVLASGHDQEPRKEGDEADEDQSSEAEQKWEPNPDPPGVAPPEPPEGFKQGFLTVKVFAHRVAKKKATNPFEQGYRDSLQMFLAHLSKGTAHDTIGLDQNTTVTWDNRKHPVLTLSTEPRESDLIQNIMNATWNPTTQAHRIAFSGCDLVLEWVFETPGLRVGVKIPSHGGIAASYSMEEWKDIAVKGGFEEDLIWSVEQAKIKSTKMVDANTCQASRPYINFYLDPSLVHTFGCTPEDVDETGIKKLIAQPPVSLFVPFKGTEHWKPVVIEGLCKFCLGSSEQCPDPKACPYKNYCRACGTNFQEMGIKREDHACGALILEKETTKVKFSVVPDQIEEINPETLSKLNSAAEETRKRMAAMIAARPPPKKPKSGKPPKGTKAKGPKRTPPMAQNEPTPAEQDLMVSTFNVYKCLTWFRTQTSEPTTTRNLIRRELLRLVKVKYKIWLML